MGGRGKRTRSNAVEHALGWVATKMGLLDMVAVVERADLKARLRHGSGD